MTDYIEGRRAVEEALRAGVPIRRLLVQQGAEETEPVGREEGRRAEGGRADRAGRAGRQGGKGTAPARPGHPQGRGRDGLGPLVERVRRESPGVSVERVPRSALDSISEHGGSHGAHQGIVAEVPPYRYARLQDVARAGAAKDRSLVVILDHMTDEGNLGAVIRTAEVVGADAVVIPSRRAAQVTVGVYKTSAGAALHLPVAQVPNLSAAISTLKQAGYWVAGASEKARQDAWHAPMSGRLVLVMGSEGQGISRLVLENCDFLVSLPQAGRVGSLNVAQATCALCYEWLRQCTMGADGRVAAAGDGTATGGGSKGSSHGKDAQGGGR